MNKVKAIAWAILAGALVVCSIIVRGKLKKLSGLIQDVKVREADAKLLEQENKYDKAMQKAHKAGEDYLSAMSKYNDAAASKRKSESK